MAKKVKMPGRPFLQDDFQSIEQLHGILAGIVLLPHVEFQVETIGRLHQPPGIEVSFLRAFERHEGPLQFLQQTPGGHLLRSFFEGVPRGSGAVHVHVLFRQDVEETGLASRASLREEKGVFHVQKHGGKGGREVSVHFDGEGTVAHRVHFGLIVVADDCGIVGGAALPLQRERLPDQMRSVGAGAAAVASEGHGKRRLAETGAHRGHHEDLLEQGVHITRAPLIFEAGVGGFAPIVPGQEGDPTAPLVPQGRGGELAHIPDPMGHGRVGGFPESAGFETGRKDGEGQRARLQGGTEGEDVGGVVLGGPSQEKIVKDDAQEVHQGVPFVFEDAADELDDGAGAVFLAPSHTGGGEGDQDGRAFVEHGGVLSEVGVQDVTQEVQTGGEDRGGIVDVEVVGGGTGIEAQFFAEAGAQLGEVFFLRDVVLGGKIGIGVRDQGRQDGKELLRIFTGAGHGVQGVQKPREGRRGQGGKKEQEFLHSFANVGGIDGH
mmetsp:Transcript_16679/g.37501  ORF Transcript_16679/g.37501 Transcript_16679/m.37501 type:complete len:491 (+) Transcript_16679:3576-5048(+)